MRFERTCLPALWSSPFARWQGELAEIPALDLAAGVTTDALARWRLPAAELDEVVLGWTVPQRRGFYGAPTLAGRIGAPRATGPMVSQACATMAACLRLGAAGVESGDRRLSLVVTTDRTSNGPVVLYPRPAAPGGAPDREHWVLDNFEHDPWAGGSMLDTAERVAAEAGISREELDDVTLLRYEQYGRALEDDRAFQREYMVPVVVRGRGGERVVDADAGVRPTTAEGLAGLAPARPGGVVTFGGQTHPADGTAGTVLAREDLAREIGGPGVVRLLAVAFARVEQGAMPKAPVPAALAALRDAGVDLAEVDEVTTHNPFAVNDVWFSRRTGIPPERVNRHGCSLVYGHPQAPTGGRALAELVTALRRRGGGVGLFTGCAAGDTAGAVVVRVDD